MLPPKAFERIINSLLKIDEKRNVFYPLEITIRFICSFTISSPQENTKLKRDTIFMNSKKFKINKTRLS